MRQSIDKIAAQFDGRKNCNQCRLYPCITIHPDIIMICSEQYRKGFKKGVEYQKKKEK